MESFQSATNWKQFQDDLALVGIRCRFRYNKKSNGIEGISFSIAKDRVGTKMRHDVSFSGKQLDPSLTLDRLCQKLGNPLAIVHEQARDMYEDARLDWIESHNESEALAEILFQPYQPAISAGGGGGSSSKRGWGDDDKYKKKKRNQSVSRTRGRH